MPNRRPNLSLLVEEIRQRAPALRRAWGVDALDRIATEMASRFDFDRDLVVSLLEAELGETRGRRGIPDRGNETVDDEEMRELLRKVQSKA